MQRATVHTWIGFLTRVPETDRTHLEMVPLQVVVRKLERQSRAENMQEAFPDTHGWIVLLRRASTIRAMYARQHAASGLHAILFPRGHGPYGKPYRRPRPRSRCRRHVPSRATFFPSQQSANRRKSGRPTRTPLSRLQCTRKNYRRHESFSIMAQ